jgi:hypothetical protein
MVLAGLGAAGAGLLALLALVIAAVLTRRRRRADEWHAGTQTAYAVPDGLSQHGPVFWREITSPHAPDPPTDKWTGPEN